MNLPEVTLTDIAGFVGLALMLATFSVRTMILLRMLMIGTSVAFLIYASLAGLLPIIVMHVILLPLNLYRLFEMRRLTRQMQQTEEGKRGLAVFLPFMSGVSRPAGTTLFRKGDRADDMYVLTSGRVRLPDVDVDVEPGQLFGEVGMFTPEAQRMATAICTEDCRLQRISRDRVRELVFQNPRIGFYLIGLVTERLVEDLKKLERGSSEASVGTS